MAAQILMLNCKSNSYSDPYVKLEQFDMEELLFYIYEIMT